MEGNVKCDSIAPVVNWILTRDKILERTFEYENYDPSGEESPH